MTGPAEALAACHGRAVIFSNELVDAFAVRRFQNTADGWQELMIKIPSGRDAIESLEKKLIQIIKEWTFQIQSSKTTL